MFGEKETVSEHAAETRFATTTKIH